MNATEQRPVDVLLSTYNGRRYLPDLVESLWRQSYPNLRLRVRDDGSTDGTREWLEGLRADPRVASVEFGENVGPARSFMMLMSAARRARSEFVALCDQDDVWLPTKVADGVAALARSRGPALYCSALTVADERLVPLRQHHRLRKSPAFANALVENVAAGSTIILNAAAVELAGAREPTSAVMHDAWLYLLIAGAGTVVFDDRPQVLYRQHAQNAIGVRSGLSDWWARTRRQAERGHERALTRQAEELRALYREELAEIHRNELDEFLDSGDGMLKRARYVRRGAAFRQRPVDDLIYRALYLLGRV